MSRIERYFSPPVSNTTDKVARLISLQIKFSLISIGFAIGYFIMSYFNGFVVACTPNVCIVWVKPSTK
jgi:hypothetical protein